MSGAHAVAVAVAFTWFGMVFAISFIEAPLKFRAPGVTLQVGLGIGRLVFRALNAVEIVLAATLLVALGLARPPGIVIGAAAVAVLGLAFQLLAVRPRLNRRSDVVLSTQTPTTGTEGRSRAHYWYIGLELVKVVALLAAGITLLT